MDTNSPIQWLVIIGGVAAVGALFLWATIRWQEQERAQSGLEYDILPDVNVRPLTTEEKQAEREAHWNEATRLWHLDTRKYDKGA